MWPFSRQTFDSQAYVSSMCTGIVLNVAAEWISGIGDGQFNVAREHFVEFLTLGAFGCRVGMIKAIADKRDVLQAERSFHTHLLSKLIEDGAMEEEELSSAQQFLAARLEQYQAALTEHGESLSKGDWDGVLEDIGIIFEQACLGPPADHQTQPQYAEGELITGPALHEFLDALPTPEDAERRLYLRQVAQRVFLCCFESSRDILRLRSAGGKREAR